MLLRIFLLFLVIVFTIPHIAAAQPQVEDYCTYLDRYIWSVDNVATIFDTEHLGVSGAASSAFFNGVNALSSDPQSALNQFNLALIFEPEFAEAYLGRSCAALALDSYELAMQALMEYTQLGYGDDTLFATTIEWWLSIELNGTTSECRVAIDTEFDGQADAFAYLILLPLVEADGVDYAKRAEAYLCAAQYQEAIETLGTVIDLEPDNARHYLHRALAYRQLEDYTRAINNLNEAFILQPDNAAILNERAYVHYLDGSYEQCIEDAEQALALNSADYLALSHRGLCYAALGESQIAIESFNQALRFADEPNTAAMMANRTTGLRLLGEYDLALTEVNYLIEFYPPDASYSVERGLIYQALGDYEAALNNLYNAGTLDTTMAQVWLIIGDLQRSLDDNAAAIEAYNLYLSFVPNAERANELAAFIVEHS